MKSPVRAVSIVLVVLACLAELDQAVGSQKATLKKSASEVQKVFSMEWQGLYGGVPPFDRVKVSSFKPALESEMADTLVRIDKIAKNPASPSFENTIVAMELAD